MLSSEDCIEILIATRSNCLFAVCAFNGHDIESFDFSGHVTGEDGSSVAHEIALGL